MGCGTPLTGFYSAERNANGKRSIVFDVRRAHSPVPVRLPCGKCPGCLLERSRQWAMRCLHESKLYRENTFVTLTYDSVHMPLDGSLVKRDFQLFMKRLRTARGSCRENPIRFYMCGEYGDENFRPHYHALLFNCSFADGRVWTRQREPLYTSDELSGYWKNGLCVFGAVNFKSAAYVARYCLKKVFSPEAKELRYGRYSADGRYYRLLPEYTDMSRRPGIGTGWFNKFRDEVLANDSVIVNGRPVRPPRFYDSKFQVSDAASMEFLKRRRRKAALLLRSDNTSRRRRVKEVVMLKMLAMKKRSL